MSELIEYNGQCYDLDNVEDIKRYFGVRGLSSHDLSLLSKVYAVYETKQVWHKAQITTLQSQLEAANNLVNDIADIFSIGLKARDPQTILINTKNSFRRSSCLSLIESHLTKVKIDDVDGEEIEDCPLRWGDSPEDYIERFKTAVAAQSQLEAVKSERDRMRETLEYYTEVDNYRKNSWSNLIYIAKQALSIQEDSKDE